MKQYLMSSLFSLSLISYAYADELSLEEQCLTLGYDTKISDCEAAGSAALVCPVNNGSSDMAICITDSCRGYPLFKKDGVFYYHDQAGNEIEAVPSKGQLTDYMEGDFETCTAGYGDNAVTYYRVPQCKGEALYNNYFCDVGCDTEKKYPYTYHPGNTAGIVQKCVTADQTYYGYSSCNKGWIGGWSSSSGVGRCGLDDCEMVDYPYPVEPNAYHYGENRGKTDTCKIGGSVYYRYTECNGDDFVLKGVNISDKKGTVCARKCPVTDCSNTPFTHTYPNGDTIVINDWSCNLNNTKCQEGDIVTYNDKEFGIIISTKYEFPDGRIKKLIAPTNYTLKTSTWATENNKTQNVPQTKDLDDTTWGKIQTNGIFLYGQQKDETFPAVEACWNYETTNCSAEFCNKNNWYLPSIAELRKAITYKYIHANTIGDRNVPTRVYTTSCEATYQTTRSINFQAGTIGSPLKMDSSLYVLPYLAF